MSTFPDRREGRGMRCIDHFIPITNFCIQNRKSRFFVIIFYFYQTRLKNAHIQHSHVGRQVFGGVQFAKRTCMRCKSTRALPAALVTYISEYCVKCCFLFKGIIMSLLLVYFDCHKCTLILRLSNIFAVKVLVH